MPYSLLVTINDFWMSISIARVYFRLLLERKDGMKVVENLADPLMVSVKNAPIMQLKNGMLAITKRAKEIWIIDTLKIR